MNNAKIPIIVHNAKLWEGGRLFLGATSIGAFSTPFKAKFVVEVDVDFEVEVVEVVKVVVEFAKFEVEVECDVVNTVGFVEVEVVGEFSCGSIKDLVLLCFPVFFFLLSFSSVEVLGLLFYFYIWENEEK